MNVDALTLWAVRDELRATVLGARVERVILPGALALGFELYAGGRRHWLYASCRAEDARVHLMSEPLVRPSDDVMPLLLLLRKYVKDGRLVSIDQPPLERVLVLGFEKWHEGEPLASRFVVEAMGRYSNLVLVDAGGRVLDAAKRVTAAMNRVRVTLPGQPYVPPPPQDRPEPTAVTGPGLRLLLTMHAPEQPVWRAFIASYRAVSPLAAREITYRGTGSIETTVGQVRDWEALAAAQARLFADADAGRWEPSVGIEILAFAPYRLTHLPSVPVESISTAVERFFQQAASGSVGGVEPLKGRVRGALSDRSGRVRARIGALERAMAQAAAADRLRTWGELVLGFAYDVRPGQTELVVEGERIPLDAGKSAVENARAYFRDYQKAKGAAAEVPALLAQAKLQLAYLEEVATQIDLADRREEIEAIERELAPPKTGPKASKRRPPRVPLRSRRTPDGFEVVVGLTSVQNDEITFKLARPDDLWFHARGVPGAHVIVRAGGRSVPEPVLRLAAAQAARHSQARRASQVAVDYTLRRYVRRIPNAPPGLVTYTHEQTVRVVPTETGEEIVRPPRGKLSADPGSG